MSVLVNLKNGKVQKMFFYKGKQVFIVHMITDKYDGYHFKIIDKCNQSETYSVPFKYENECEKMSIDMIRNGKI